MYITITFCAVGEEGSGTLGYEIVDQEELLENVQRAFTEWLKEKKQGSVEVGKATSQELKGAPWVDTLQYETDYMIRSMPNDTWELLDSDQNLVKRFE